MRRSLLVLGITLAAALPARADLTHRLSSSIQLDVKGASTRAVRVGNSYSISGSGVATSVTSGSSTTADAIGGLGAVTAGVNAVTIPDAKQATGGNSFSFANSFTQGDVIPTAAPTVGAVPAFGDITSESAGSAGTLAATINTSGAITLSPGTGTGISAIGQVITELTTR